MLESLFNFIFHRKQNNDDEESKAEEETSKLVRSNRRTADDYRTRFKQAPLGRWSQAAGTFSVVRDEVWQFNPDRTGNIVETSFLGGNKGETQFEWKKIADFTIACRVTRYLYENDEAEAEEETEPSEWSEIRYDFDVHSTDSGDVVAMYQVSDSGSPQNGFWWSMVPLVNNDDW